MAARSLPYVLTKLRDKFESPDQKAVALREYYEDLKKRHPLKFTSGEDIEAPPVNDIYGELLMRFASGQGEGWYISGGVANTFENKPFWEAIRPDYFFDLDAFNVVDELNNIGYVPKNGWSVIITERGIVVTRVENGKYTSDSY